MLTKIIVIVFFKFCGLRAISESDIAALCAEKIPSKRQ